MDGRDIIVLYGNIGETHETAFKSSQGPSIPKILSGNANIQSEPLGDKATVIRYVTVGQIIVEVGNALVYIVGQCSLHHERTFAKIVFQIEKTLLNFGLSVNRRAKPQSLSKEVT